MYANFTFLLNEEATLHVSVTEERGIQVNTDYEQKVGSFTVQALHYFRADLQTFIEKWQRLFAEAYESDKAEQ